MRRKKALKKDFRMEIRKSLNRFLSILFIVAMGVAFYSGIQSASPDMKLTEDSYFDDAELMDIRVVSTLGLTREDLEAIRQVEGVAYVEGSYQEDVLCGEGESRKVLRIESMPEAVNLPAVEEGRFPEKPGEVFLDSAYARNNGYEVGDTLKITYSGDEEDSLLVRDTYTVCGYGNSPLYIAVDRGSTTLGNGELAGFACVVPEDFDSEVFVNAYVQVEGAKELRAYTEEYDAAVETVFQRIEEIQDARCEVRYREIIDEAESELEKGRREVEDGKRELADARQELTDAESEAESELAEAESELLEGESELADGKKELADARTELLEGESELEDGEQELAENEAELADGLVKLEEGRQKLADGESTWQSSSGQYDTEAAAARKKLIKAQKEIDDGKKELKKGWETYRKSEKELREGQAQYDAGVIQLQAAREQYEAGLEEMKKGQSQYDAGTEELARGQAEYDAGAARLAEGQAQYDAGVVRLAQARTEYEAGAAQLAEGEASYEEGMSQLIAGREQYESGQAQLAQAQAEYESGKAELDGKKKEYEQAEKMLEEPLAEYEAAAEELASQREQYNTQWETYQKALGDYAAAEQSYQSGLSAYEEALPQVGALRQKAAAAGKEAESLLAQQIQAAAELEQVRASLSDLESQMETQKKIINDPSSDEAERSAAQQKADSLAAQIKEQNSAAAAKEKRQSELAAQAGKAQQEQSTCSGKADSLESQLAGQKAELDAASAQLAGQKSVLDETGEVLAQADQELTGGENALAENKAELDKQEGALADAKAQLDAGEAQLAAGKAEIEKNAAVLAATKVQLEESTAALADARAELDENAAVLAEAKQQLDAGYKELADSKAELDKGWAELAASKEELENGYEQLAASKAELDTGYGELAQAKGQIDEGQAELDDSKRQIAEGERQLAEAKAQLEASEKQLEAGQKEVDAGYQQLKEAQSQLRAARKELDLGWGEWSDSQAQLDDGQSQLEEARQQIEDARSELKEARQKIADGEKEIRENEQKLADGWSDYEEGKQEAADKIAEAKEKIADAEQELEDAEQKLADGEEEIAKIKYPEWYVYDRDVLPDNSAYGENAERMSKIGEVFPVLFFLVAALISLTTMTRMVEEERTQIGTLKALGYSTWAIASKYLKYAFLATVGGSILGILVGEKILPWIIINAYGIMYQHTPQYLVPYNWGYGLLASGAALICTVGAAFSACFRALQDVPASLMRPPAPKQGKRVLLEYLPFLWKHLSFSWKSSIRNLLRYKKRCLMTILGIGGCMGLLLVGYGLRDSIMDVAVLQFDELQLYEAMTILDDGEPEKARQEVVKQLEEDARLEASKPVYMQKVDVWSSHETKSQKQWTARLVVPETLEDLDRYFTFRDRNSKEEYTLEDDGAIITEKLANELELKPGDTVVVEDEEKGMVEIPIVEICENYLYHYVYLSPALYESLFGKEPQYNSVMMIAAQGHEDELQEIGTEILKYDGALSVTYTYTMADQVNNMLGALDIVIVVLIVSAGMLAFVVLYNLNNININERKRELATIKVLGFYDGEVGAYVYRENILLTVVGAVAGVFIGKLLHGFIIGTVEVDSCMFGRTIKPVSFLYGVLFTFAFSIIVNGVMYFKLKKIDMVESLKSIE